MKILVVSNLYPPRVLGGYEINCSNVVRELRGRGHDVQVLTTASYLPGDADPDYVDRTAVMAAFGPGYAAGIAPGLYYHATDTSQFENVVALHRAIEQHRPEIVFLWNLHGLGGLHLIDFLATHRVPWAIYLGDRVFEQIVNSAPDHVKAIFRGGDSRHLTCGGVMAVSSHLVAEIEALSKLTFASPPTIVHGYVPAAARGPRSAYRRDGKVRFASAGRVCEEKGTGLICEAAALVLAQGHSAFEIDIFGDGDVPRYLAQVNASGLSAHVRFHGPIPQRHLLERYRDHDIFLFPTWSREPFAFAPFEAAACGCVPILTEDCGCAERIVDMVHGIKVARTAPALADAMQRVITGAVDLDRLGRAAMQMVLGDLSLAGHVDKILGVLQRHGREPTSYLPFDSRAKLLAYVKHHLSIATRLGLAG